MKNAPKTHTSSQIGLKSNPLIKGIYSLSDGKIKKTYAYCAYYEGKIVVYGADAAKEDIVVTLDVKSVIKSLKANNYI